MAGRGKKEKRLSKNDDTKLFAWLATFFTVIGFVIALLLRRENDYVMYYAKQGLILFVGFVIAGVIQFIPIIGQLFMLFVVVLWVIAWINALSGERRHTWLVQDFAQKIKL